MKDPGYTAALEKLGMAEGLCQCCGQNVKLYSRSINHAMAVSILLLARSPAQREGLFTCLPKYFASWPKTIGSCFRGGDFMKLKHWNLIEAKPGERDDGSHRNGWWRLTEYGIGFSRGVIGASTYAYVFNDRCYGQSMAGRHINDCLNKGFNFQELMGAGVVP